MSGLCHRKKPRSLQLRDKSILCVPPSSGVQTALRVNTDLCQLCAIAEVTGHFWGSLLLLDTLVEEEVDDAAHVHMRSSTLQL